VKPAKDIAQDAVLWLLVAIVLVWGLTGCSDLRRLTMTKDEVHWYQSLTYRPCLDPTDICIVEGKR